LYRKMGTRINEEVSALGFGCMRFPTFGDDKKIERTETNRLLARAVDGGVNYFDTAWPYHGGESEEVVGEFFAGGGRDQVLLATKMPVWKLNEADDLDRIFEQQLEKLKTDHIDFYLMHALEAKWWTRLKELDGLTWAERMKEQGKIRYLGFSFHDGYQVFVDIIDGYDGWDFCQVQYNYMNETIQAGTAGVAYAAQSGLGIVIMEPLLGGALASPPDEVRSVFAEAQDSRSPVEHALRWLWDKPDVGVILSGMSTMEQLEENLAIADRSPVGCMPSAEIDLFRRAKTLYEEMRPVPCTSCRYCMPCPHGVYIPDNFETINNYSMYGNRRGAEWRYNKDLGEEHQASACTECGECEPKCPQQIPIIESLKMVHKELHTST